MRLQTILTAYFFLQCSVLLHAQELTDEDGFRVNPYEPVFQPVVDLAFTSSGDRHWDFQHVREKVPTQLVSRGSRQITTLHRAPIAVDDFNRIKIELTDGRQLNVQDWMTEQHCDALFVLKNGKVVNEQYFHGMSPDRDHVLYSLGKSLTATMLATLLQGPLNENMPVETYAPALSETNLKGATIRDLLDMKSGVQYEYFSPLPGKLSDLQIHMAATGAPR